jgi:hypothetical protein
VNKMGWEERCEICIVDLTILFKIAGFWIYLVAPFPGAVLAGLVYKFSIGRHYKQKCVTGECKCD